MATSFSKTRKVYRRFVYLDADEILNGLAGIEGGAVTERIRSLTKEVGGDVALRFPLFGMDVGLGGRRRKDVRDQLTLKQTIHSTTAELLRQLEPDGMARLDRAEQLEVVFENLVVRFDATLGPLPYGEQPPPLGWLRRRLTSEAEQAARSRMQELGGAEIAVVAALSDDANACLGMQLSARWLVPAYRELFSRRATVVGQVTQVAGDGEACVAREGNGTTFEVERLGAADPPPARHVRVVVRPLCIYK